MGNFSRLTKATKRHNANINMVYGCTIDTNVYCYRLVDGKKVFCRVKLGRGWQNIPFDVAKLSCYEKGEESMGNGRKPAERPSDEELRVVFENHKGIDAVRKALKTSYSTAKEWLIDAGIIDSYGTPILQGKQEHTPPAEDHGQCDDCLNPLILSEGYLTITGKTLCKDCNSKSLVSQTSSEPTGDQPEPAQDATEPAKDNIPNYTPEDNDCNDQDESQRKPFTITQYEEMVEMTDERQTALQIFLENQSYQAMLKRWVGEVFEHSGLSRDRKLRIIGMLIDMGA